MVWLPDTLTRAPGWRYDATEGYDYYQRPRGSEWTGKGWLTRDQFTKLKKPPDEPPTGGCSP